MTLMDDKAYTIYTEFFALNPNVLIILHVLYDAMVKKEDLATWKGKL